MSLRQAALEKKARKLKIAEKARARITAMNACASIKRTFQAPESRKGKSIQRKICKTERK